NIMGMPIRPYQRCWPILSRLSLSYLPIGKARVPSISRMNFGSYRVKSARLMMAGAPMRLTLSCNCGSPNPSADCCLVVGTPAAVGTPVTSPSTLYHRHVILSSRCLPELFDQVDPIRLPLEPVVGRDLIEGVEVHRRHPRQVGQAELAT